jgi:Na+/glutamate symporter
MSFNSVSNIYNTLVILYYSIIIKIVCHMLNCNLLCVRIVCESIVNVCLCLFLSGALFSLSSLFSLHGYFSHHMYTKTMVFMDTINCHFTIQNHQGP